MDSAKKNVRMFKTQQNQKPMRKALGIKRLHASKTQQKSFAVVPPWVIVMYNTIFFRNCVSHPNAKRNELDRFCIDCLHSFCSHCLPAHALHKHVKIRRYIYSDVINRQDLCKLFNCSGIQTYLTNKAKVLFLKQRTHQHQQQQNNSRDYSCTICDKSLQDNSLYCSIECKVLDIYGVESRRDESSNIHHCSKLRRCLKDEDDDDEYVRLPSTTKRRLRQTRKGVPLRAPMF